MFALALHLQFKSLDNFTINNKWQHPFLEDSEYKLNIDNYDFNTGKISKYLAENINVIKKHGDHAITEEPVTFRKNEKAEVLRKKKRDDEML